MYHSSFYGDSNSCYAPYMRLRYLMLLLFTKFTYLFACSGSEKISEFRNMATWYEKEKVVKNIVSQWVDQYEQVE